MLSLLHAEEGLDEKKDAVTEFVRRHR